MTLLCKFTLGPSSTFPWVFFIVQWSNLSYRTFIFIHKKGLLKIASLLMSSPLLSRTSMSYAHPVGHVSKTLDLVILQGVASPLRRVRSLNISTMLKLRLELNLQDFKTFHTEMSAVHAYIYL